MKTRKLANDTLSVELSSENMYNASIVPSPAEPKSLVTNMSTKDDDDDDETLKMLTTRKLTNLPQVKDVKLTLKQ